MPAGIVLPADVHDDIARIQNGLISRTDNFCRKGRCKYHRLDDKKEQHHMVKKQKGNTIYSKKTTLLFNLLFVFFNCENIVVYVKIQYLLLV